MKYSSITDIYNRLVEILENKDNESPERLGSYIVGCTIVLDDIDKYFGKYPILSDIADLGSDLEINNTESSTTSLAKIKSMLEKLKSSLPS
jgi:hypothetical protein